MSKNLEFILAVLEDAANYYDYPENDSEKIHGFIACARGESIQSRGFDETSHLWKQGWRACKEIKDS